MKNWKTSLLGFIAATILLATSKGYIDTDAAAFIGSIVTLLFGIVSSDGSVSSKEIVASEEEVNGLIGTRPNDR